MQSIHTNTEIEPGVIPPGSLRSEVVAVMESCRRILAMRGTVTAEICVEVRIEELRRPIPRPVVSEVLAALPPSRAERALRATDLCGTRFEESMHPAMHGFVAGETTVVAGRPPTTKPLITSGAAKWATGIPPLPPVPANRLSK